MQKNNAESSKQGRKKAGAKLLPVVAILLLVIAGAISIYLRQEREMKRLAAEHEELVLLFEAEVRAGKDIEELNAIVGSDRYIESFARDKLGLVRPDEIIFIHD